MPSWVVYMLRCSDGSLYTGITKDLVKRINQHHSGKGSKYVRSRLPAKLVWQEEVSSGGKARTREAEIKQRSRAEKEEMIRKEKDRA
ncbi:MAG TPA: GIY-YIG nuclease family protein [Patescibacteria group bacterium]|nr:GIY-YIG nuclease family protein [Patescibacteria group bacterium]